MKKRLLSLLFILSFLLPLFSVGVSADEENDPYELVTVPYYDCDKPFGTWTAEEGGGPDGGTCLTKKTLGMGSADSITFSPVDGSQADTLEFDLFLSSLDYFDIRWGDSHLEITSAGKCDDAEYCWSPAQIKEGCVGGARIGWNHVILPFREAKIAFHPNHIDIARLNFLRFFFVNPPAPVELTMKIDNFVLTNRDAKNVDALEDAGKEGEVLLHSCNLPFGGWQIDRTSELAGSACLARQVGQYGCADAFILDTPVDASGMNALSFGLWVSDPAFFEIPFADTSVEITSAGEYDKAELSWRLETIRKYAIGGVHAGWNHILLPFEAGLFSEEDPIDLSAVNYLRFYFVAPPYGQEITVKIDHFAFVRFEDNTMIPDLNGAEMIPTEHSVPVYGCNEPFGDFTVDYGGAQAGSACLSTRAVSFFASHTVFEKPVNAGGMDTLEFDFYVTDLALFDHYRAQGMNSGFELTSSGTCDKAEISWNLTAIRERNHGEPIRAGWNHVILYLDEADAYAGDAGPFDISAINFMRFFMVGEPEDLPITVKLDNIRLTDLRSERYRANKAAADGVIDMMSGIGEITYRNLNSKKTMVSEIRRAYDALTDEQRGLIPADTRWLLSAAEDQIKYLSEHPEPEETEPPETEPEPETDPETEPAPGTDADPGADPDQPAAMEKYPLGAKGALFLILTVSFLVSLGAYMTVSSKRAKANA